MSSLYNKNYNPDVDTDLNTPSDSTNNQQVSQLLNPDVQIVNPTAKNVRINSKHTFNVEPRATYSETVRNGQVDDEDEEQEAELILKYDAEHVIKIFKPVTVCLILVIICLSSITSYQKSQGQQL
jgi:hypothetical protein